MVLTASVASCALLHEQASRCRPCCWAHAGRAEELDPVIEGLEQEGIFVRKLQTNNVAFHSSLLDGCLDALKAGEPMRKLHVVVCTVEVLPSP